jgi:hypothetical protein
MLQRRRRVLPLQRRPKRILLLRRRQMRRQRLRLTANDSRGGFNRPKPAADGSLGPTRRRSVAVLAVAKTASLHDPLARALVSALLREKHPVCASAVSVTSETFDCL